MTHPQHHREGEEGYLLVGLVVACFLILLALSVAAPRVAKELERDREVEATHRAQEYVRAIQLYYRRNNAFPASVDQLVGSGGSGTVSAAMNVRYLRQKYKDPLTNDEFRLIHVGEAQTEVKGFFGAALEGLPQGNLGAAAGMVSNLGGSGSTPGAAAGASAGMVSNLGGSGSTPGAAAGASAGGNGFTIGATTGGGPATSAAGASTAPATGAAAGAAGSTGTSSGPASTDATTFQGSKGAIVGVGSNAKGEAIVAWNGSEDISQWEFLYDPRVELLKAKVSIFGGTPAASGTGSLGNGFAPISGATGQPGAGNGGTSPGTTPTTPSTGSTPSTSGSTPSTTGGSTPSQ